MGFSDLKKQSSLGNLTSKLNLKKKFNSAEKYRVRDTASPARSNQSHHFFCYKNSSPQQIST